MCHRPCSPHALAGVGGGRGGLGCVPHGAVRTVAVGSVQVAGLFGPAPGPAPRALLRHPEVSLFCVTGV